MFVCLDETAIEGSPLIRQKIVQEHADHLARLAKKTRKRFQ